MTDSQKTYIGGGIILLILLFTAWKFMSPALAAGGNGANVDAYVPPPFQVPQIVLPDINVHIDTPGPIVKPPPTCGCITGSQVGMDFNSLPIIQWMLPPSAPPVVPQNRLELLPPKPRNNYTITANYTGSRSNVKVTNETTGEVIWYGPTNSRDVDNSIMLLSAGGLWTGATTSSISYDYASGESVPPGRNVNLFKGSAAAVWLAGRVGAKNIGKLTFNINATSFGG